MVAGMTTSTEAPSAHRELGRQVRGLFTAATQPAAGRWPTVGIELELLVHDVDKPWRTPVPPAEVRAALAADPRLPELTAVSFEPGGQLELSVRPATSVTEIDARTVEAVRRVDDALIRRGLAAVACPVDSRRPAGAVPLQEPTERYVVMREHFDSAGTAGARMMCQTAALQVCVGLASGERAVARQWLAANLAGPSLAAAFRHSPAADNRTAVWLAVDRSRTGLSGSHVDADRPAQAYRDFALTAEVLPMGTTATDRQRSRSTTLASWMAAEGHRPDEHDLRHHLTTLFPPVRPRGDYLETRFLDTQPVPDLLVAAMLVAVLLGDTEACESVIAVVGADPTRLADQWSRCARLGTADPVLLATAVELGRLATDRARVLRRTRPGWLPAYAVDRLDTWTTSLRARGGTGRRSA
jgi:glutamate--cysteine ligase